MSDIKAILFDLGNVVVRFDPAIVERGYASRGKITSGQVVEYIMDSSNMNGYMEGKLTSSQFYMRTRSIFKLDLRYHEFYDIWNSMFYPYPEMEELIKKIKDAYPAIKLVLISNTNEAHYEFLVKKYKVLELLDGHILSHVVGKQKPDTLIFTKAMELAGSIPKNTFYTDDRLELIEAARVMGIRAHQFIGHEELRVHLEKYGIKV